MIFLPELLEKILAGQKRQTRRMAYPDDEIRLFNGRGMAHAVVRRGRILWEVGRTYAACPGRGKRGVCRLQLDRIRLEKASHISDRSVQAEGFGSRAEFFEVWDKLHPNSRQRWVWVLDFTRVEVG